MKLEILDAPEFGEGIKKLNINGLLVSVYCPGSECEQSIKTITKSRKKQLKVSFKPVDGEITMKFISDKGEHSEIVKIPKDVLSLHINDLPINIFTKTSKVAAAMQVLFPDVTF